MKTILHYITSRLADSVNDTAITGVQVFRHLIKIIINPFLTHLRLVHEISSEGSLISFSAGQTFFLHRTFMSLDAQPQVVACIFSGCSKTLRIFVLCYTVLQLYYCILYCYCMVWYGMVWYGMVWYGMVI